MRKGITAVVAVVFLIAIAIIASISIYFWMAGLTTKRPEPVKPTPIVANPIGNGKVLIANLGNKPINASTIDVSEGDISCPNVEVGPGEQVLCKVNTSSNQSIAIYGGGTGATIVSGVAINQQTTSTQPQKNWYYKGWAYRREITVVENSGNDLYNYQIQLILNSSNFNFSRANPDGSDIRFTYLQGDTEAIANYWIEYWNATQKLGIVWVKLSIPANGNVTVYMYYGNPTATTTSNPVNVFDFYDGIETGVSQYWEDISESGSPQPYVNFTWDNSTKSHGNSSVLVELWSPQSTTYNAIMRRNFTGVSVDSNHGILLWFNYSQFGGHGEPLSFRDQYLNPAVNLVFRQYYTGDSYVVNGINTGKVLSLGEWYRVLIKDLNFTNTSVDVTIYDSTLQVFDSKDDIQFANTNTVSPLAMFYIIQSSWYNTQSAYYNFDSLAVFKYIEPEPTYTIGAEEEY